MRSLQLTREGSLLVSDLNGISLLTATSLKTINTQLVQNGCLFASYIKDCYCCVVDYCGEMSVFDL